MKPFKNEAANITADSTTHDPKLCGFVSSDGDVNQNRYRWCWWTRPSSSIQCSIQRHGWRLQWSDSIKQQTLYYIICDWSNYRSEMPCTTKKYNTKIVRMQCSRLQFSCTWVKQFCNINNTRRLLFHDPCTCPRQCMHARMHGSINPWTIEDLIPNWNEHMSSYQSIDLYELRIGLYSRRGKPIEVSHEMTELVMSGNHPLPAYFIF